MNAIVVPRSIALQSQLGQALLNLDAGIEPVLLGAEFNMAGSGAIPKPHIVAMIYLGKNAAIGADTAEELLNLLKYDEEDRIISNSTLISNPQAICLLGLPTDVFSYLPIKMPSNSGVGYLPDTTLQPTILEQFIGYLVWVSNEAVTTLVNFVNMVVAAGQQLIGMLQSGATAVINDIKVATEAVVNVFNAFVDWAVEFISATIDAIFGPMINQIQDAIGGYCSEILSAVENIKGEQNTMGTVSTQAINKMVEALSGSLFDIFFVLTIALETALLVLTVVTNVFSFLIVFVASVVLGIIINQMLDAESAPRTEVMVNDGLVKTAAQTGTVTVSGCQSIRSGIGVDEGSGTGLGFSIIDLAISQWILKIQSGIYLIAKSTMGKISLALGCVAIALSAVATLAQNDDLSRVAFDIGVAGLIFDAIEIVYIKLKIPTAHIAMEAVALGLNIGSICISYATLNPS